VKANRDGNAVVGQVGPVATPEGRGKEQLAGLIGIHLVPPLSHRQEIVGKPHNAGELQVGRPLGRDRDALPGRTELRPRVGPNPETSPYLQAVPPRELLIDHRLLGPVGPGQPSSHQPRATECHITEPVQPDKAELAARSAWIGHGHDQRRYPSGIADLRQAVDDA
jgi:hypothetical protein